MNNSNPDPNDWRPPIEGKATIVWKKPPPSQEKEEKPRPLGILFGLLGTFVGLFVPVATPKDPFGISPMIPEQYAEFLNFASFAISGGIGFAGGAFLGAFLRTAINYVNAIEPENLTDAQIEKKDHRRMMIFQHFVGGAIGFMSGGIGFPAYKIFYQGKFPANGDETYWFASVLLGTISGLLAARPVSYLIKRTFFDQKTKPAPEQQSTPSSKPPEYPL